MFYLTKEKENIDFFGTQSNVVYGKLCFVMSIGSNAK